MAQIDSSIYSSFQAPDILGSIQKGLSVRDMINTRDKEEKAQKKEQALAEAYNAGVSKNPDGTVSYDGMKTASKLSDLGYGKESIETLQNYKAQQKASIEEQRKKLSEMTDYLGRASQSLKQNPGLYQNILQDAKARGFDVSTMPPQYGPDAQKMIDHYHGQALTVKDQVENQFKQQQFAAEQKWKSEDNNIKREELGIKKIEAQKKAASGENLPLDSKKLVDTLATKNANKISIKNQIDSTLSNWNSLSDDQKVATGRQLLKTLNSTEGADAIGAEEANRLGSKLEFALGNIFNSNPTQFGRDLEGFYSQAKNTSEGIGRAVNSNQGQIDSLMGRPTQKRTANVGDKPGWAK